MNVRDTNTFIPSERVHTL